MGQLELAMLAAKKRYHENKVKNAKKSNKAISLVKIPVEDDFKLEYVLPENMTHQLFKKIREKNLDKIHDFLNGNETKLIIY